MLNNVICIEGLDFLGKTTLVRGLINALGYHQIIHFDKPRPLQYYVEGSPKESPLFLYQRDSFINSMHLANSGAKIIFDRWHIGEAVWAPAFRGYDGNYVFDIERDYLTAPATLILLVEDFRYSNHFSDDGESLNCESEREEIQNRFIAAMSKSHISDKRIVCVTDVSTGSFRDKNDILNEVLNANR